MKLRQHTSTCAGAAALFAFLFLAGCGSKEPGDPKAEAPPPAQIEREPDASLVKVDHPDQFPISTAALFDDTPTLDVTGVVSPDVSRNVPVISLASGRIIEVNARLGDEVKKGQLLMKVHSADISGAFSDYRQAVADEVLARAQLERAKILLDKGAIAAKDVEVAQDAEDKAKVDIETARGAPSRAGRGRQESESRRRCDRADLGRDYRSAGHRRGGHAGSRVAQRLHHFRSLARVGDLRRLRERSAVRARGRIRRYQAERLSGPQFRGRIANIGPILDPNIRTAKVRIEMENPGVHAARHVRHRHVPRLAKGRSRDGSGHRPCCTCTIAIGSTCPSKARQASSAASK